MHCFNRNSGLINDNVKSLFSNNTATIDALITLIGLVVNNNLLDYTLSDGN